MEKMPLIVAIVDSVFSGVKHFHQSLFSDKRRTTDVQAIENHSEMNSVVEQPMKKRRKVHKSVSVNFEYVNRINDWLAEDDIITIGIYGMGGVGKTTIAKHLYERRRENDFHSTDSQAIAWVTMEMDFTIYQLQKRIAAAFGLDLEGDKDENRRAATLYAFLLRTGKKCMLFIDELWSDFRREDVGIPRNCKLIVISRLFDVCRMLRCQKTVKVEPLSLEESWQMFHHSVGGYAFSDSDQVSSYKKLVFDKCAGLPLAIAALANSVSEVINVSTCSKLSIESTKMEELLYNLKRSYDKLKNAKLQRCFLCSASYLKGNAISKEELIHYWIRKKLIDEVPSLEAQFDMAHSILNKLLNYCLLETCQDKSSIKMHDFVRLMANSISTDCSMVKADIDSNSEFCKDFNGASLLKSSASLIH